MVSWSVAASVSSVLRACSGKALHVRAAQERKALMLCPHLAHYELSIGWTASGQLSMSCSSQLVVSQRHCCHLEVGITIIARSCCLSLSLAPPSCVVCRSDSSNRASMLHNSLPPLLSSCLPAQSLPACIVQPPAPHFSQTQPLLSSHPHLFQPTLTPTGLAPHFHPAPPSILSPHSSLLPPLSSATPLSDTIYNLDVARVGSKACSAPAQTDLTSQSASQRLHDTAPMPRMPLYSADAYSAIAGSFPRCSTWPQESANAIKAHTTWLGLAEPPATLPMPGDTALQLGACKLVERHAIGSEEDASSIDSDPAALVEDALLGELFFAQTEACQVTQATTDVVTCPQPRLSGKREGFLSAVQSPGMVVNLFPVTGASTD